MRRIRHNTTITNVVRPYLTCCIKQDPRELLSTSLGHYSQVNVGGLVVKVTTIHLLIGPLSLCEQYSNFP